MEDAVCASGETDEPGMVAGKHEDHLLPAVHERTREQSRDLDAKLARILGIKPATSPFVDRAAAGALAGGRCKNTHTRAFEHHDGRSLRSMRGDAECKLRDAAGASLGSR